MYQHCSVLHLRMLKNTIQATTQRTIRTSEGMNARRFKTVPHQCLYKHLGNDYLS